MKSKFFYLFPRGKLCLLVMLTKAALNAVLIVLAADLLRTMVDDAAANTVAWSLKQNGGYLILLLLIGAVNHLLDYWKETLFERERYYVTHKIFCSILEMPYDAIMQKGTAEYFNLISSDLGLATGVLRELDAVILQSARSLGAVIFIFSSEWRIGCGLLALGLVIILYNYFLSPVFGRIQQKIQADDCHVRDAAMQEYASHEYRHFYSFAPLRMKYENAYSEYIGNTLKKAKWRGAV